MTERLDVVIVGAGVVGLAIGRAFALTGRDVVVLEKNVGIGMETSSRNSEVIHAGIYYRPESLKGMLCVRGKKELYRYCEERGIQYSRCGKLIVATKEEQLSSLAKISEAARLNGVDDLISVSADEMKEMEPEVAGIGALLSPSTGIVDSHAYMLALQGDIENAGGAIAFGALVERVDVIEDGLQLQLGGADSYRVKASILINAAGLGAQKLANRISGLRVEQVPPLHLAKGNYFSLIGKSPFRRLIYPVPSEGGLGIHATIDLAGRTRFGPDVEWVDDIDYSVEAARSDVFCAAIRQYWPNLSEGRLVPDYAGIRPKVERPGGSSSDFIIRGRESHGIDGLVSLFGIESPGLTASLALADHVVQRYAA